MPDTGAASYGSAQEGHRPPAAPRSIALVGPFGSGKSTLFDALLAAAGAPARRGAGGGPEMRMAHCTFMGDPWALLDCPGSVEFAHQTAAALAAVDLAVLVCDPTPSRALAAAPLLKALEAQRVPFLVFVNRVDTLADGRARDTLEALQGYVTRPLVLRQVPIREGGAITGYVDVVSERAYRYRPGQPSELISIPDAIREREQEARTGLLERLADYDDALLEKLIEDVVPAPAEIYGQLRRNHEAGGIVEVLLGAADRNAGIRRLWKALRHEVPTPDRTALARGLDVAGEPLAQVFRTVHAGHAGKLSFARVWRGPLRDGARLGGERVGGILFMPNGGEPTKAAEAQAGDLVALARMEGAATGAVLGGHAAEADGLPWPEPPPQVYALAIATEDRKDDVKLSGALAKLAEEDPSLRVRHDPETGETILSGQGEMHLRAALERLAKAHGVKVAVHRPRVKFKEAIRRAVQQHGRLKRQTGGHGQFADVVIDVAPLGRGEGFRFVDKIVGGVVPRNYIPAVGEAAEEATRKGPLGYPVVDVSVTLVHGGFHAVDSSDMAFKSATRAAMQEALAKADPVLLEPVDHVTVSVPNEFTAATQRLLTTRRGRILGYAEKGGWPGWDDVEAQVPAAELGDLIIELRSLTMGLGTFVREFDHLAEASGRMAEKAVQAAAAG